MQEALRMTSDAYTSPWGGIGHPTASHSGWEQPLAVAASSPQPPLPVTVRLRGLPFSATEQDVITWMAQHNVADRLANVANAVTMTKRANGKPSGCAILYLRCREDADVVSLSLHEKAMCHRYVEVLAHEVEASNDGEDLSSMQCLQDFLYPESVAMPDMTSMLATRLQV